MNCYRFLIEYVGSKYIVRESLKKLFFWQIEKVNSSICVESHSSKIVIISYQNACKARVYYQKTNL